MKRRPYDLLGVARPGTATDWLVRFLKVPREEIIGCSDEQLKEIEAGAGRPLPIAYKQWMTEAGIQIGKRGPVSTDFHDSFMTYPRVLEVREIASEVIREAGASQAILEMAFPFYNWEVYELFLVELDTPYADPPVLLLDEDDGTAEMEYRTFTQFIVMRIFGLACASNQPVP